MQRLHQEDLVGEVMEREHWDVLSLPAIALDDECYRYEGLFGGGSFVRKAGEALHPERDSVETYRKIRETVGEYNFESQYQQSPFLGRAASSSEIGSNSIRRKSCRRTFA